MNNGRVLVSGAFYGTNFGDHLFADLLTAAIGRRAALKNASKAIRRTTGARSSSSITIPAYGGVVFGPGGYLGEGPKDSVRKRASRMRHHYIPALYARLTRTPYIVVGVGVGPVQGGLSRRLLRIMLEGAREVTVRDVESKQYLAQYGINPNILHIGPDAALAFESVLDTSSLDDIRNRVNVAGSGQHSVFIHVAPGATVALERVWEDCVDFYLRKGCDLVFGSDFVWDAINELPVVKSAKRAAPERVQVCKYRDPLSLLGVLEGIDSVVTHKLHVGILGSVMNKCVVSFPIHPKTVRFYQQIGEASRCIPVDSIGSDETVEHLARVWGRPVRLSSDMKSSAQEHFHAVRRFLASVS